LSLQFIFLLPTDFASDYEFFPGASLNADLEELRLAGKQNFLISDVGIYLGLGFKNLRKMEIDLGQKVSFVICHTPVVSSLPLVRTPWLCRSMYILCILTGLSPWTGSSWNFESKPGTVVRQHKFTSHHERSQGLSPSCSSSDSFAKAQDTYS
jgi:hypothetical protein